MRWSQLLIPTLREAPADAEIASHRLLLRAGLARKLAGGIYTFLPLGLRVLRKIETITREEMNRAGAQELLMPALQPVELWKRGPRYVAAKPVMFRAQGFEEKKEEESELVLGPTHEEVITDLVATNLNSYRHLPKTFYQIQTKFRNEIRPRFGLMRAKEFSMKDAYSFDATDEAATVSYQKMYQAYERIFARIGLKAMVVEADTGVMGGSFSHEFSVPCSVGESEIVFTEDASYAAAIEKAVSLAHPRDNPTQSLSLEKFATPDVVTIEDLTQKHAVAARDQIKTLVYLCDEKLNIFLIRGDHSLNEAKVGALGFNEYRPATAQEIQQALGANPGSLGATGNIKKQIHQIFADETLQNQKGMVTGANEDGFHLKNVDVVRDISVDRFCSLRTVLEGEKSLEGKPLAIQRAIEVGHVFKLGTKYSEALGANFLDAQGKSQLMVMGCYGIGVTRSLQAVIEQNHDDNGILWPTAIAPFPVVITLLDQTLLADAEILQKELSNHGIDSLLDDRDERPGIKFKDADLVGFPIRITVGEKSKKAGGVEMKLRHQKESKILSLTETVAWAADYLKEK
ncbi:MAG: proline--tRNA ligase [Verrucomicrobiae bacterium]|nr:proline--tRNA ligase [Verrucomicrobiae bacterium]